VPPNVAEGHSVMP